MGELVGLGFFDAGLFGVTWSTLAFGFGRRSARCRDAFRRTRTATIIPPRIALEKVMFWGKAKQIKYVHRIMSRFMRTSIECQYQRNVTFSLAVGWIKKLMILDSTNWVESQEKGVKKIEAIARDTNDRLSELTWDWGKKIDLHARGEIFSSYCIAVKLDRTDDRIRVNLAWREHVNHIYSHLKVHSFRKSLDSSTCELSFYHDVSLFFDRNVFTRPSLLQRLATLRMEYS